MNEYPKVLLLQINRFSASNIHHRPRKNCQSMVIYDRVKLSLVQYQLLGLIEHHGSSLDCGHYTCLVNHEANWFSCSDTSVTRADLPCTSQNTYLLFYVKCGSWFDMETTPDCSMDKNVLKGIGGRKPSNSFHFTSFSVYIYCTSVLSPGLCTWKIYPHCFSFLLISPNVFVKWLWYLGLSYYA